MILCRRHEQPAVAAVLRGQGGDPSFLTTGQPDGVPLRRVKAVSLACPRCTRSETVSADAVLEQAERVRVLSRKMREIDLDTLVADTEPGST